MWILTRNNETSTGGPKSNLRSSLWEGQLKQQKTMPFSLEAACDVRVACDGQDNIFFFSCNFFSLWVNIYQRSIQFLWKYLLRFLKLILKTLLNKKNRKYKTNKRGIIVNSPTSSPLYNHKTLNLKCAQLQWVISPRSS